LELELYGACFLEKIENHIFKFTKTEKKNLDIVGDVFCKGVKFQFKRPYTLPYIKMPSSDKF
jgi:hypothetical protein